MSRGVFNAAFAGAFWAALAGGSLLLLSLFMALPASLLAFAWLLFLGSVAAAFTLAVIASRREGTGVARALLDGVKAGFAWVVAFLP